MSTRRSDRPYEELSENRYMSSPEYAELRGLNAVHVKDKAAIAPTARKRSLIWFLDAMSRQEGGMKKVAGELMRLFPERFKPANLEYYFPAGAEASIERFLIGLCIDPRVIIQLPGEEDLSDLEEERLKYYFPEITSAGRLNINSWYRSNIGQILMEYRRRHDAEATSGRYQTAIGKQIWRTLDFGLKTKSMVMVDGLEGRGKTEEAKAWCMAHLGEARYVSLKGINSKTAAFREMAKACGIASSYTRKASEMQARVEDVFDRSKLMLVIDEAHWLFNQSARIYTRPELMDWLVTAICNRGIPVASVTTPQFIASMAKAAHQVGWNYKQFFRRVARREALPERNSTKDIEGAVRWTFPKAGRQTVSLVVGHILLTKRDLSALGDVTREVRYLLNPDAPEEANLSTVTHDQVEQVVNGVLVQNDAAFLNALRGQIDQLEHPKARGAKRPQPGRADPAPRVPGAEESLPLGPARGTVPTRRFPEPIEAPVDRNSEPLILA